jgi:hypothetical protein
MATEPPEDPTGSIVVAARTMPVTFGRLGAALWAGWLTFPGRSDRPNAHMIGSMEAREV